MSLGPRLTGYLTWMNSAKLHDEMERRTRNLGKSTFGPDAAEKKIEDRTYLELFAAAQTELMAIKDMNTRGGVAHICLKELHSRIMYVVDPNSNENYWIETVCSIISSYFIESLLLCFFPQVSSFAM